MDRQVSCERCLKELQTDLGWKSLSLPDPPCILRPEAHEGDPGDGAALVGFLSAIRAHRVQVAGAAELDYLNAHPGDFASFLTDRLQLLVLADGVALVDEFWRQLENRKVAIFATQQPALSVLVRVQHYLQGAMAPKQLLHGVLVDVLGVGILLQGEAGIGKSELALELVSRNHRLVADDSVLCVREAPGVVTGHCPPALQNFMEVRGLGIVNIRELFGAAAIVNSKRIRLVIEIRDMREMEMADLDRLHGQVDHFPILGVDFARLRLPVSPARNLAVLVEAAARRQYVKESGTDMLADFDAQFRLTVNSPL